MDGGLVTASFNDVASGVRTAAIGQPVPESLGASLTRLGYLDASNALSAHGLAFDDAWTVFRDRDKARQLLSDAHLACMETGVLIQALHGRGQVAVGGALHVLARHGVADPDRMLEFRQYLQALNEVGIVAYSKKQQTVRILAALPVEEGEGDDPGAEPAVRIIQPDRQFSNVLSLRQTLRSCRGRIWWVDPHFSRRGLEPLAQEADGSLVTDVRILSGPANATVDASKDFARFEAEMAAIGIAAEWRVIADKADQDFHDRFIVTDGKAWNVPPVNTLFKGDYSEISETSAPPFDDWWSKGGPLPTP